MTYIALLIVSGAFLSPKFMRDICTSRSERRMMSFRDHGVALDFPQTTILVYFRLYLFVSKWIDTLVDSGYCILVSNLYRIESSIIDTESERSLLPRGKKDCRGLFLRRLFNEVHTFKLSYLLLPYPKQPGAGSVSHDPYRINFWWVNFYAVFDGYHRPKSNISHFWELWHHFKELIIRLIVGFIEVDLLFQSSFKRVSSTSFTCMRLSTLVCSSSFLFVVRDFFDDIYFIAGQKFHYPVGYLNSYCYVHSF